MEKEKKINLPYLLNNIFGYYFVNNNANICKMIIDNREYELAEQFDIKNNNNNNILKIKLKGVGKITNMSGMFNNCSSLLSLPDFSKWSVNNVTDMNHLLNNCLSLTSIPDISNWNTSNVTDMRHMFCYCTSLSSLPDISKWNTNNVKDMRYMFYGCSSLSSLPDIPNSNDYKVGVVNGCLNIII